MQRGKGVVLSANAKRWSLSSLQVVINSKSKERCAKVRNWSNTLDKQAKITTKGQITVPLAVRRALGVGPGDALLFETDKVGVRVRPVRNKSPFAMYRGIGNR